MQHNRRYIPHLRTALVLIGTGTAGAYHAGVVRALNEAGIKVAGAEDWISEDAKLELLPPLSRTHGQADPSSPGAPRRITLRRKSQSELRLSGAPGRSRPVNVAVRRKRTYIKRDVLEQETQEKQEALDRQRQE